MKYIVTKDYNSWRCGDGCCSDSWYEVHVYAQDVELTHELLFHWERVGTWIGDSDKDIIDWINEELALSGSQMSGCKIVLDLDTNCTVE